MGRAVDRFIALPRSTYTATFAVDANDAERLEALWGPVQIARSKASGLIDGKPGADADQEVADAEEAYRQALDAVLTVTFEFGAIGTDVVTELVAAHPATKAQKDKARKAKQDFPDWNEDTFPPAILSATCTRFYFSDAPDEADTSLTEADAALIYKRLSLNDKVKVVQAATYPDLRQSQLETLGND
jgi:hypothetical protein